MAKVIAFSNQKGGVGKTTTCVNLAAFLAEKGKRVLVVDADPQGNASSSLGVYDKKIKTSTYTLLCGDNETEDCVTETDVGNLFLVPSSQELAGAEIELAQVVIGREKVLAEKLEDAKRRYDYIFLDCPPSLGLLTVNALAACDVVIIPLQCEYFALEGMSQMMNTIKLVKKYLNKKIEVAGVVVTMYDGRAKLTKGVLDEIDKLFADKVFSTKIPRNVRLAEAPSYGKPINIYDNKCVGARAYSALADEFIEKIK